MESNINHDAFVNVYKSQAEKHLECVSQEGVEIRFIDGAFCLFVDGFNWMNTNTIDVLDHKCILDFHGRVIFTGLGLGVCVAYAVLNPNITQVDVIENDPRIIALIQPLLERTFTFPEGYLNIIAADADTYCDLNYDCAFLDHYPAAIPADVKEKYTQNIPRVVCWYDEALKLLK